MVFLGLIILQIYFKSFFYLHMANLVYMLFIQGDERKSAMSRSSFQHILLCMTFLVIPT